MSPLQQQQIAFAAHLRDPQTHALPAGVDPQRAALYRRLFRNNIAQLLARNFPVIHASVAAPAWSQVVDDFCRTHPARTPVFPRIGGEFVAFLQQRQAPAEAPWLAELARHEWMELELRIDDTPLPAHDPQGDLLAGVPVCSPWLRVACYQWPVQHIGPANTPLQAPATPTWLLARRGADGQVRFAELNAWAARLLELLAEPGPGSGEQRLRRLAAEAGAASDAAFAAQARALLQQLHAQGSVLGSRIDSAGGG
ncbi:MAG TPA: putative DNA-binding domain-containing protein [Stenotrophomonas sp.]|nr:putative DNA-binding domain-containing protein [Stenotrophomonas sp.]